MEGLSGTNPERIYANVVEYARAQGTLIVEQENPEIKNISRIAYLTSGGGIVKLAYDDGSGRTQEKVRVTDVEGVSLTV